MKHKWLIASILVGSAILAYTLALSRKKPEAKQ